MPTVLDVYHAVKKELPRVIVLIPRGAYYVTFEHDADIVFMAHKSTTTMHTVAGCAMALTPAIAIDALRNILAAKRHAIAVIDGTSGTITENLPGRFNV